MPIVLVPKCLEPKLYPLVYCDTNMKYISFVGMVRTKCEHKMHDLIGDSIRKPEIRNFLISKPDKEFPYFRLRNKEFLIWNV